MSIAKIKARTELIEKKLTSQYGSLNKLPPKLLRFYILRAILDYIDNSILQKTAYETTYDDFLKSQYWQIIRQYLLYIKGKCEACGQTTNLTIHHVSYKHFGFECKYMEDLQVVCYKCHLRKDKKQHGKIKTYYPIKEILPNILKSM